jgi:hypothetical protein
MLLGGFADGLQVESGRGWTSVVASVTDQPEFWALLDRFQELAIHVTSINELGAEVLGAQAMADSAGVSQGDSGAEWRQWLAAAAAHDPGVLARTLGPAAGNIDLSGLDIRSHALVRLAALVAAGESREHFRSACETALDRGVTCAEITGALVALVPVLGSSRIVPAAAVVLGCC